MVLIVLLEYIWMGDCSIRVYVDLHYYLILFFTGFAEYQH